MYINHRSQQFSYDELVSLLSSAGFKEFKLINTHPQYSLIVAEKP